MVHNPGDMKDSEAADAKLVRWLGADTDGLSAERLHDLMRRLAAYDADGVAAITGLQREGALRMLRRFGELEGQAERRVLRTSDARRLRRDILALLSARASSGLGKARLLNIAPSTDRSVLEKRFAACVAGKEVYDALKGRLEEVRAVMKGVAFADQHEGGTIGYFVARGPMVKAARSLLALAKGVPRLAAFLEGADDGAFEQVAKAIEGMEGLEIRDAQAVISDAELKVNEELEGRRQGMDADAARRVIENAVSEAALELGMDWQEEEGLREAAFANLSLPFEFDRGRVRKAVDSWRSRQEQKRVEKLERTESTLERHRKAVDAMVEKLVALDGMLAVASVMDSYSLSVPEMADDGIGFVEGRNIFLLKELLEGGSGEVKPVSYSIGRTRGGRGARNVVMLTGANSGGKTTLLTTVAAVHVMTLLGLPVPCKKAEVTPMPVYLFRRRVTKRIGSLEHALRSLIPVFADRRRKLVLMDEFEALTEPGAAGRILATIMNKAVTSSSLLLLVTHLARETLPHVKLRIRVDGIEAKGLDDRGELVVDRQPIFNHIGSSTPKLVIMKLSKVTRKKGVQSLYRELLLSFEEETEAPVQTPIGLPWVAEPE
ncbi:MAG: hypothetical protein JRN39_04505 [Nitrososphaerota archaeon]|nr:hypothetical protein [Nitrososphaerota archaeon]